MAASSPSDCCVARATIGRYSGRPLASFEGLAALLSAHQCFRYAATLVACGGGLGRRRKPQAEPVHANLRVARSLHSTAYRSVASRVSYGVLDSGPYAWRWGFVIAHMELVVAA